MAREGWLAKVHSEQFHLPKVSDSEVEVEMSNSEQFHLSTKVSDVGPGGWSTLITAEREKHTQVNATQTC